MLKTLFITTIYRPDTGGIEVCLENIIKRLPSKKAVVLAPVVEKSKDFDQRQNYQIYRRKLELRYFKPRWILSPIFALKIAYRERVESVQAAHGFASYFAAWVLRKIFGLPYSVWAYGLDILAMQRSPLIRWWVKRIYRGAQGGVANSNFTKRLMVDFGLSPKKIKVVYPGVDSNHFKPNLNCRKVAEKYRIPDNKNILLSVSRLVSRKGFDLVIRALPKILKRFPNTVYLIGGEGRDQRRLDNLVRGLPLFAQRAVRFLGFVSDAELPCLYNLASVFLMPSRFRKKQGDVEGFGMVFLEAGACGCPVIGGNSGGVPEAIQDQKTGFLVDPQDPSDLAAKVVRLLADSALRKRMGRLGRVRAIQDFNWEKIVKDFLK